MLFSWPGSHLLQTPPLLLLPRQKHIRVFPYASEEGHSPHLAKDLVTEDLRVGGAVKGFYFCIFWDIDAMSGDDAAIL